MTTLWVIASMLYLLVALLDLPTSHAHIGYRSRSSRVPLSSRLGYRDRMFNSLGGYRRSRSGFQDRGFDNGYYNNDRFDRRNNNRLFNDNRFYYNSNQHLGRLSRNFRMGFDIY